MSDYMQEARVFVQSLCWAVNDGRTDDAASIKTALLAHIERGRVPEGWKLVPVEPTKGMWLAGVEAGTEQMNAPPHIVYSVMLAAAPAVPNHSAAKPAKWRPLTSDEIAAEVLPPAEVAMPEPRAWEVWVGICEMLPLKEVFRSKAEAEAVAATVKSNTEVRPLFGDSREAAGYARGLERAAVIAWMHYMDKCRATNTPAASMESWCAAGAIRAAQKGGA